MIQQRINTVEGLVKSISIAVNNLVAEDDTMKRSEEHTSELQSEHDYSCAIRTSESKEGTGRNLLLRRKDLLVRFIFRIRSPAY